MSNGMCLPSAALEIRERPPVLRALGAQDLPSTVVVQGAEYQLLETFKHDTWAATGLYAAGERQIVCKFNREQSIFLFPGSLIGSILAHQERSVMQRLAGIEGIPTELGPVYVAGSLRRNAVARTFIPGEILTGQKVPAGFFGKLRSLLQQLHGRGVAYTDLHKTENILIGDDGKPYLFDFQISQMSSTGMLGMFSLPSLLIRCLQQSDLYHLRKHVLRDELGDIRAEVKDRPWWIELHRLVAVPWRTFRRRLLVALRIRAGEGAATSEAHPEMAFRSRA
ncbi:hypothetical protein [Anatilimnocola floriformis]|uniref:hypothetical protein n=1 Tax=Anatilimnocola floriformis TaxID=2948575 RepID=UPI0020C3AE2D|nr:hypothetical protein [Anatilimnocola floriformis]